MVCAHLSRLPSVDEALGLVILLDEDEVFAGAALEGVDARQQIYLAGVLNAANGRTRVEHADFRAVT